MSPVKHTLRAKNPIEEERHETLSDEDFDQCASLVGRGEPMSDQKPPEDRFFDVVLSSHRSSTAAGIL